MKATLRDVQNSRMPEAVGACATDVPTIAALVNEATLRLLQSGGATGWWGNWVRVVFNVSADDPYITLPRTLARIINLDVCNYPIRVWNEFYEVLPGGIGLQPNASLPDWCGHLEGYERGTFPTMVDLTSTNQLLRVYLTDVRDVGRRVLIGGLDQNGNGIYSQDGNVSVDGFYLTLDSPFATSTFIVTQIDRIVKDPTYGDVILKQVDATTGAEVTLSRYTPDETEPDYRRYYITKLPSGCCVNGSVTNVQVTAIAKKEYVPVSRSTDSLLIANIPALIEECLAIRYSQMDTPTAAGLEVKHHRNAIRLLNNELRHYEGEQQPAVNIDLWSGAPLENQGIGTLI